MIWGHLGFTILSFLLPYGRLLFLNDCFIFWQKLTFTGNILITASGALKRQDNTDITPKYHRTLPAERSLCLLNAPGIAHEFASSLEARCPGFFIRLHVCHLHQHSPNVHVQRNSRPSLGLTETLPRNIQGTVVITIIVIAQITPSHPAPTGQWIIGKQACFFLAQREGHSFLPQTVAPCGAEPQSSKLWSHSCSLLRGSLVTTGK